MSSEFVAPNVFDVTAEAFVTDDRRRPVLGCIADDFTGATDLGSTLTREGMTVIQTVGVPRPGVQVQGCDALVVGLKTRTAAVDDAIAASISAARWLLEQGAERLFFKYCSTFDSRSSGNIGPVADALLDELGVPFTIVCPAYPETGRTVYQGHLFVDDLPLHESSMRNHPLTPMNDSSLLRLLRRQTPWQVALVGYPIVERGPASISTELEAARKGGARYVVIDALNDRHLRSIGEAVADLHLITGASGVARGLPGALRRLGVLRDESDPPSFIAPAGPIVVLAGSASPMTRVQVAQFGAQGPVVEVDPLRLAGDDRLLDRLVTEATRSLGSRPVLVHAANGPEDVRRAQHELGIERSAALVEMALSRIAGAVVAAGARRLIVAGGETSAAVVQALGVSALRIGPEIALGVPWCVAMTEPVVALALKSGNFGGPDFFADAIAALP